MAWGSGRPARLGFARGGAQQGFRRYRLTVLPPGVTEDDRRRIRLARAWPTWGSITFLASLAGLGGAFGHWIALTTSAALGLGAGAWVLIRAGEVRTHVRTLSVILVDRHHDPRSADRFALLKSVTEQLVHADLLLEHDEISVAHHEVIWGLAYDRLAPEQPQLLRTTPTQLRGRHRVQLLSIPRDDGHPDSDSAVVQISQSA